MGEFDRADRDVRRAHGDDARRVRGVSDVVRRVALRQTFSEIFQRAIFLGICRWDFWEWKAQWYDHPGRLASECIHRKNERVLDE